MGYYWFRHCRCSYFFQNGDILVGLNLSFLVMILKIPRVCKVDEFRHIILNNFLFKIITKILATCLVEILKVIVSDNQFGFILERRIHDCIVVASEGINCLNKRAYRSNMAIKVDIRKAFNSTQSTSFNFLRAALDFWIGLLRGFLIFSYQPDYLSLLMVLLLDIFHVRKLLDKATHCHLFYFALPKRYLVDI